MATEWHILEEVIFCKSSHILQWKSFFVRHLQAADVYFLLQIIVQFPF